MSCHKVYLFWLLRVHPSFTNYVLIKQKCISFVRMWINNLFPDIHHYSFILLHYCRPLMAVMTGCLFKSWDHLNTLSCNVRDRVCIREIGLRFLPWVFVRDRAVYSFCNFLTECHDLFWKQRQVVFVKLCEFQTFF